MTGAKTTNDRDDWFSKSVEKGYNMNDNMDDMSDAEIDELTCADEPNSDGYTWEQKK